MRRASPFRVGQFPQNVVSGVDLGLSAQNMTSITECAIEFDSQILRVWVVFQRCSGPSNSE